MVGDPLSEVFDAVEIRGLLTGGVAVSGGRWISRTTIDDPLKLMAVARGHARLSTNGVDTPLTLGPGDVVIVNGRSWLTVEGGSGDEPPTEITVTAGDPSHHLQGAHPGAADVLVGVRVDLNAAGRELLLAALPPVGHVRATAEASPSLRASLDRLVEEATGGRMGSAFAIHQHGQLLMLEVLRAYLHHAELPSGWLRLLTDEPLRPALTLMHAKPGHRWGLAELAHAAAMSRTTFAQRFRTVAGTPPLTYLHRWRMLLAQRALRDDDVRVRSLALQLGYASESAFSTAFKREMGQSPLRYRHQERSTPRLEPATV